MPGGSSLVAGGWAGALRKSEMEGGGERGRRRIGAFPFTVAAQMGRQQRVNINERYNAAPRQSIFGETPGLWGTLSDCPSYSPDKKVALGASVSEGGGGLPWLADLAEATPGEGKLPREWLGSSIRNVRASGSAVEDA